MSTLTKVSQTARPHPGGRAAICFETDSSGACDRMLTRSTMIDDRLDANCCRTALILSEYGLSAFRIASCCLKMAGATRVANCWHIARTGSRRRPVHRRHGRNRGCLIGGRQPQASILLLVLLDAFRPQIEKRNELGPIRLPKSSTEALRLLCAIFHAGKLGGNRPEGIDGEDLLTVLQPDVSSGCARVSSHFPRALPSRQPPGAPPGHSC